MDYTVHLPVAKNRISLSYIELILGQCMYQKVVFFSKKVVHCSGTLLKKRKRFFLYFLNGFRYHKIFNRFEFQVLKAIDVFGPISNDHRATPEGRNRPKITDMTASDAGREAP